MTTERAENERALGTIAYLAGGGTKEIVGRTSVKLEIQPAVVWFGLAAAVLVAMRGLLSSAERRGRIFDVLEPIVERAGAAMERSDQASVELETTRPIPGSSADRLEMSMARVLARRPDLNMGEIADELRLNAVTRRELSRLLQQHPVFERSSRHGWSVGRYRDHLETTPRPVRLAAEQLVSVGGGLSLDAPLPGWGPPSAIESSGRLGGQQTLPYRD